MSQPHQKHDVGNGWSYLRPREQLLAAFAPPGSGSFQMGNIGQPATTNLPHQPHQNGLENPVKSSNNNQAPPDLPSPASALIAEKGFLPCSRMLCSVVLGITILILIIFSISLSNENRDLEEKTGRIVEDYSSQLHMANEYIRQTEAEKRELAQLKTLTFKDENGNTNLHIAVISGLEDGVKSLVESGANVNARNNESMTPLHLAATSSEWQVSNSSLRIMKYLIENGADVLLKDEKDLTFLHYAVLGTTPSQFKDLAEFLVERKYSHLFNIPGGVHSSTPFQLAVMQFELNKAILTRLHMNGVNFNAVDGRDRGYSVLFYALFGNRKLTMLSNLVKLGADWRHRDVDQHGLLHETALLCNLEGMQYFINLGLDVNAKNVDGDTPLDFVLFSNERDVLEGVRILMRNGADPKIPNNKGRTALAIALAKKYDLVDQDKIVELLKAGRESG